MIKLVLLLLTLHSPLALAKDKMAFEVTYKNRVLQHRYYFNEGSENSKVKLILERDKGQRQVKLIPEMQAELIKGEARRIIWKAQPSRPGQACTEYARIRTAYDQAIICQEDKKSLGRAYGFLNSLSDTVTKK